MIVGNARFWCMHFSLRVTGLRNLLFKGVLHSDEIIGKAV